ncbi:DNA protecting protein DprA [Candidatus Parcubacteria bacterium A4]|nr:MAG: DNA protecting protein DprA [Candidatus Parcubacteria bacterium A4]
MNNGIQKITINDAEFPKRLKKIPDPPKELYFRGNFILNDDCFAVVGTRMCSAYGRQMAMEITSDLAEAGLTIVSGLAPGIDTYAHQSALEKKSKTIAVLGTGLDDASIYPQINLKLAKDIVSSGGMLVSEYPPGTKGTRFAFPRRNRIITGLSIGLLVVEAKEKSGSLLSAGWAKKQKKKVFAVPGQVHFLNSKGCHSLIKQGAKLVENADDILKDLISFSFKKIQNKNLKGENEEENLLLKILEEEPLHTDKIIEKAKMPAGKIVGILAILEIKGKVLNLEEGIYAIKR